MVGRQGVLAVVLGSVLAASASSAGAASRPAARAGTRAVAVAGGIPIGVPTKDIGGAADAGEVLWLFRNQSDAGLAENGAVQLTEASVGGTVAAGDRFGAAVAVGDFNDDGYRDLAVGAPGADGGMGCVYVISLTSDGSQFDLAHATTIRQGVNGTPGAPEAGDHFGAALTVGETNLGERWLAIGAPDEDIGAAVDAGDVTVVPHGTDTARAAEWFQGHGAPGAPGKREHFGASLAEWFPNLAVGVPGQRIGTAAGAGEVDFLYAGSVSGALPGEGGGAAGHQGADGVPGDSEAGDHWSSTMTETMYLGGVGFLAIGAPDEDIGTKVDAGAVTVWAGPGSGNPVVFYQGHAGMPEKAEVGDQFGAALDADGFNLAIGAPGEDLGSTVDAGVVHILHACCAFMFSAGGQLFAQSTKGVPDDNETGDRFGAAIGGISQSSHPIVIAAPGEDTGGVVDTGALTVLTTQDANAQWITAGIEWIDQNSPHVPGANEAGDALGTGLWSYY